MNAYLIDGGLYDVKVGMACGYPETETYHAVEVVFAETRGKARAIFLNKYACYDFEWTSPISIRLIEKNVSREAGIAKADDEYWWPENWPFPDPMVREYQ